MSTVSKTTSSPFWQANFRDYENNRWNKSTSVPNTPKNRSLADTLASFWEMIAKKDHSREEMEDQLQFVLKTLRSRLADETKESSLRKIEKITANLLDKFHPKTNCYSFVQLAKEFMDFKALNLSPTSLLSYRRNLDDFISFVGDDLHEPIDTFKREWVRQFQTQLAAQKRVSNQTINGKVKTVRAVLKFAYQEDHALVDYGDKAQNLKAIPTRHRRPFSPEEISKIWAHADTEWRRLIAIGLHTGQRISDIALMRWDDVDLNEATWCFHSKKTNHSTSIPLSDELLDLLKLTMQEGAYVNVRSAKFLDNKHGTTGTLSNQFRQILFKAGLRDQKVIHQSQEVGRDHGRQTESLGFHCLRHTAATALHEAGCPLAIAKEIIGHCSDAVHSVYVKPHIQAARKEIEKIAKTYPLQLDTPKTTPN